MSSINNYRTNYFGYSNLSLAAPYVNYVLFSDNSEQDIYTDYINLNKREHYNNLKNKKKTDFYKNLDQFFKQKLKSHISENPFSFIVTSAKSILSMYIFSSHPNENIIISKILNLNSYQSSPKEFYEQIKLKNNFLIEIIYYLIKFFSIIFGFILFIFNVFFLIKTPHKLNQKLKFLYSINFSCFVYLLCTGFLGGLSYNDRGLAVVYNLLLLTITYYLKDHKYFKK